MKATIWHNPKCSTSRKAVALLKAEGVDLTIVEYLKDPPTKEKLKELYRQAGITAREGLRTRQDGAKALLDADDETILDAMVENPALIERPLIQTEKGARLGRPIDKILEIL